MSLSFPIWVDGIGCQCPDPSNPCMPSVPPLPDPNNPALTCPSWTINIVTGAVWGTTWDIAMGYMWPFHGSFPARPFAYPANLILGGPSNVARGGLHGEVFTQAGALIWSGELPVDITISIPAGATGLIVRYTNPLNITYAEAGVGYFSYVVRCTSMCTYPAP